MRAKRYWKQDQNKKRENGWLTSLGELEIYERVRQSRNGVNKLNQRNVW